MSVLLLSSEVLKIMALQLLSLSLFFSLSTTVTATYRIGVNYGTVSNNLPPPYKVVNFLQTQTTIDRVKIFDTNPDILRAFAGTNIFVTVGVANSDIPSLSKPDSAVKWVADKILPFYPKTRIRYIAVGNEVLATSDKSLVAHILPAMVSLKAALDGANATAVSVTTPHSLGLLSASQPPSSGEFRKVFDEAVFAPILDFHRKTNSPFMVNPYPYFGIVPENLNFALFKPNEGVFDPVSGFTYTNMFEAQLDAVYSAMKRVGYGDVEIVVAETGWPSAGDPGQFGVSLENAISFNANLIKFINSGKGTPLMPNRSFETYVFSLFNENLKPTVSEQNFGLFKPDFEPVYDVGVFQPGQAKAKAEAPSPSEAEAPSSLSSRSTSSWSPSSSPPYVEDKKWCVPKPNTSEIQLQTNIDYICNLEVDCGPIQEHKPCFEPNNVRSHASYAMNAYYQTFGHSDSNCDFNNTGIVTHTDPSHDKCSYTFEEMKSPKSVKSLAVILRTGSTMYMVLLVYSLINLFTFY